MKLVTEISEGQELDKLKKEYINLTMIELTETTRVELKSLIIMIEVKSQIKWYNSNGF